MPEGLEQRPQVQDNLLGAAGVKPVAVPSTDPRVMTPSRVQLPQSLSGAMLQNVSKWANKQIQEAGNIAKEQAIMDGQMAHVQGQTMEQVEMNGNPWALEGYRLVQAQAISSSMLAAQQEEIANSAYAEDPDAYRSKYMSRVTAQLEEIPDARTRELARDTFLKQMPVLAQKQVTANLKYKEQQAFDTLEEAVGIISKDPTATDALVSFAQGAEGSATSGLSEERRTAATVSGVVRALGNDNPEAYDILAKAGLLGENLTTGQMNQVRSARKSFESRKRSEYNKEFFDAKTALLERITNDGVDPSQALEEMSVLYAEHDITINAVEAGAIFNTAQQSAALKDATNQLNIQEAVLRKDYDTVASLSIDALIHHESRGNPNAMGPVIQAGANKGDRAVGMLQVMPKTARNPGFGIRPIQNESKAEYERVGREYWGALVSRYNGDIEAAAVAYNAGAGNADKWIEAGRDYATLPDRAQTEPYAKGIAKMAQGGSPKSTYEAAKQKLSATRQRLAMDTYESMQVETQTLDAQFKAGDLSIGEYKDARDDMIESLGIAQTKAMVDHEMSVINSVQQSVSNEAQSEVELDARVRLDDVKRQYNSIAAAVTEGRLSSEEGQAAMVRANAERQRILTESGLDIPPSAQAKDIDDMVNTMQKAIKQGEAARASAAVIERAKETGTLGTLPKNQQQAAVQQERNIVTQEITDLIARGELPQEQAMAVMEQRMAKFFADTGVVDDQLSAVLNASFSQDWTDKTGEPTSGIVDALATYRTLKQANPKLAAKYLPNEIMRDRVEIAITRAGGPQGDLQAAAKSMGNVSAVPMTYETAAQVASSQEAQDAATAAAYDIVTSSLAGVGDVLSPRADLSSSFSDRTVNQRRRILGGQGVLGRGDSSLESSVVGTKYKEAITAETAKVLMHSPGLLPQEAARQAAKNIQSRSAIIGDNLVTLPNGVNMLEQFFGADAANMDIADAPNAAIMHYLRTSDDPRLKAANATEGFGFFGAAFSDVTIADQAALGWTGVRPFVTTPMANGGIGVQFLQDDGGYSDFILLDTQQIGADFLKEWRGSR